MNRIKAAITAFKDPAAIRAQRAVSLPVVRMAEEKDPWEVGHAELSEDQKAATEMLYSRFMEEMGQMWKYSTDEYPDEKACLSYGRDLIRENTPDKSTFMHYAMLWPFFYVGCGVGIEIAMKINEMEDETD